MAEPTRPDALDPERLAGALQAAHLPTAVAVLFQLTGERRWLEPPYRPGRSRGLEVDNAAGLSADAQQELREALLRAVVAWADGAPVAVPEPRGDALVELLRVAMGEPVPSEYEPVMAEILAPPAPTTPEPGAERLSALVIGAGVSGMNAAIRLRALGVRVTVLEKNDDVGGTWLENGYPGAGVDTPSHLYSLSYHPRDWETHFGKRDEVQAYLRSVADEHDVRPMVHFATEVARADWDDVSKAWTLTTTAGLAYEANLLISATGVLNRPQEPKLPGRAEFGGQVFHSARWPADLDVTDQRVVVVGTGASAMQIVPAIVDRVARLTVLQRSPQWIAPNGDYFAPVGDDVHLLMREVPFYREWYRVRLAWTFNDKVHPSLQVDPDWTEPTRSVNASNDGHRRFFTNYLQEQLAGRPDLVDKALPSYPAFGKRMLLDNGWFAALRRDHVELVTERAVAFTPAGLRDSAGDEHEADVIVLCTGFQARSFLAPMQVRGRSGVPLAEQWGPEDATAHLGITVPDFPNLFLLLGPGTALGHGGSAITISEYQVDYLVATVRTLVRDRLSAVEVRPEVAEDYTRRVDAAHAAMIWTHPGMSNWYRNAAGRVVTALPWRIVDYRAMTREPDLAEFSTTPVQ